MSHPFAAPPNGGPICYYGWNLWSTHGRIAVSRTDTEAAFGDKPKDLKIRSFKTNAAMLGYVPSYT